MGNSSKIVQEKLSTWVKHLQTSIQKTLGLTLITIFICLKPQGLPTSSICTWVKKLLKCFNPMKLERNSHTNSGLNGTIWPALIIDLVGSSDKSSKIMRLNGNLGNQSMIHSIEISRKKSKLETLWEGNGSQNNMIWRFWIFVMGHWLNCTTMALKVMMIYGIN